MRSIVLHYARLEGLARVIERGDFELECPPGEEVRDGEWLLVVFEIGDGEQRTAAAGTGSLRHGRPTLRFADRDWERLQKFVEDGGNLGPRPTTPAAPPMPISSLPPSYPGAGTSSVPPRAAGGGARVLVVDDEPLVREMVGTMLEAVGLVIETSTSGEDALDRIRRAPFDLLVLDWHLPGMTGLEVCRHVRRDVRFVSLPVLFLTANASSRDMVEAFASGADDYVMKPFRAPELGARIFSLLRRARMSLAPSSG